MFNQVASTFSIKKQEIGTMIISFYIFCEYLAVAGIGSGGVSNIGSALHFIELGEAGRWITSLQTRLSASNMAQYFNWLCLVWLSIAILYLVALYTKKTPSNLLPRPAIATSLFWALGTDFFNEQAILSTYSYTFGIALTSILIINVFKKEQPLSRTALAAFACIGSPIFLLSAPVLLLIRKRPDGE